MEKWIHYILLVDELDQCKEKEDEQIKRHIQQIQESYKEMFEENSYLMDIDKEKQWEGVVQDKNMLLYKLYNIFSEHD